MNLKRDQVGLKGQWCVNVIRIKQCCLLLLKVFFIFRSGAKCWEDIMETRHILYNSISCYNWSICENCRFTRWATRVQAVFCSSILAQNFHFATILGEQAKGNQLVWFFEQFFHAYYTALLSRKGLFLTVITLTQRKAIIPVAVHLLERKIFNSQKMIKYQQGGVIEYFKLWNIQWHCIHWNFKPFLNTTANMEALSCSRKIEVFCWSLMLSYLQWCLGKASNGSV